MKQTVDRFRDAADHGCGVVFIASLLLAACAEQMPPNENHGGTAVDAAPDHDAETPLPCTTFGTTGAPPRCKVFAFCTSGDYELDCNRDDGRCGCRTVTGKGHEDVPYDPSFCALPDGGDATATSEGLTAVFGAAMRACAWTP